MEQTPLWRTCRVLANRPRLKILGVLRQRQGMRVSDVARVVRLSLPAASQYLRALEACGLVESRRIRGSVIYGVIGGKGSGSQALGRAVADRMKELGAIDSVFKLATAFANPGRIEVFQRLRRKPRSAAELSSATGWSRRTLLRHLAKLESRGFVRQEAKGDKFGVAEPNDAVGRALAKEAVKASGT
jgi:DNA-binding transcriptional ArsR family regulator